MRKGLIFAIILFFGIFVPVFASYPPTSRTYLKLNRQKISSTVSGTLCHKPSTDNPGTEGKVSITFPDDFAIDSSIAGWTTNTENLPSGSVVWPGIGSAAFSVLSKTVTFISDDLPSSSSLYCFNFESTSSFTSPTPGDKKVPVITYTGGNEEIDFMELGIPILRNDHLTITGQISETPNDFLLDISKMTSGETYSQDSTMEFQIKFSSLLLYNIPLTIEASWPGGEIEGAAGSTVDVVEYVTDSASTGYNETSPVIDLVNKRITWNIRPLTAGKKDQSVFFKLRTNSLYQGTRKVKGKVVARVITDDISMERSADFSYLYSPQKTETEVPGTTSTMITLRSVTHDQAVITISTQEETKSEVNYGTMATILNYKIGGSQYLKENIITIDKLLPETAYYFRVTSITKEGISTVTDIFSFTTAEISVAPEVEEESIVFTSADVILSNPETQKKGPPSFTLPQGGSYNFRFKLNKPETVKEVRGTIRNKTVLGITSEEIIEPSSSETTLFERLPGVFEGRLKTPDTMGTYEIYIRVIDYYGNIVENKLGEVYVSEKFTVRNRKTGQPVEGAQILLYLYNPRTRLYNLIPEKIIPIRNPSYTDIKGQISFPLSPGRYKAQIAAIGYKPEEVEFPIGSKPGEDYPKVHLKSEPFNLFTAGLYYWTIISDLVRSSQSYIQKLSYSVRFFEINALFATFILIFLTLLSFSARLRIPLHSMIEYFLHRTRIATIHKKMGERIKGRIFDEETGKAVTYASVYLIDTDKNKIVGHCLSDDYGDFSFIKYSGKFYELEVMKEGYEPIVFHESEIESVEMGGYLLTIHKHDIGPTIKEKAKLYSAKTFSLFFETLLILSVVSEFSLGYALGWYKIAPFLSISIFNLVLWIIHLGHLRSEKNIF
ncbi:MAG: hypothetical protein UT63_C0001G0031 [Candidatus Gottesmanbacteria bacterium GW2011_GWC2_39_8]|uniref:Fibronectin type-III domain-containing protein n=1 Tax=Candidatus Gottesmanbacteria bacterium GW2011_GWC2_39_8 TaxID=1618450 RepID=A0A0G0Q260_9BACT|nr:MAG: hypothetical protein UT63_C0001G0031 [Candidatus Gottesmanbacteria bacterium GW2011_GWC2_39_8]